MRSRGHGAAPAPRRCTGVGCRQVTAHVPGVVALRGRERGRGVVRPARGASAAGRHGGLRTRSAGRGRRTHVVRRPGQRAPAARFRRRDRSVAVRPAPRRGRGTASVPLLGLSRGTATAGGLPLALVRCGARGNREWPTRPGLRVTGTRVRRQGAHRGTGLGHAREEPLLGPVPPGRRGDEVPARGDPGRPGAGDRWSGPEAGGGQRLPSRITRATSAGSSFIGTWPQPGSRTRRARGMICLARTP